MEKKNFMFHKGCPLTNKRKLYLVLHAEMCSQLDDNYVGNLREMKSSIKMNPNWDYKDPNSQRYNFPDCENCTLNVIWGYSGFSGYSGYPGTVKPSIFRKFKNWVQYMRRVF